MTIQTDSQLLERRSAFFARFDLIPDLFDPVEPYTMEAIEAADMLTDQYRVTEFIRSERLARNSCVRDAYDDILGADGYAIYVRSCWLIGLEPLRRTIHPTHQVSEHG